MKRRVSCLFLLCLMTYRIQAQQAPDIYSQLATIDNAVPGAPVYKTAETADPAIEKCAHESIRTEFDTTETVLARVAKAPCKFAGVTTFKGRGDAMAGDLLKYDPERQIVYWEIQLLDNVRYGQIALPDLTGIGKKELTKEQKNDFKTLSRTSFLFLPLYGGKDEAGIYQASNAFGAKTSVLSLKGVRYTLAINMGKELMVGQSFRVATIPLPRDKAPDLLPNLDVQLYWLAARPCDACLTGGQQVTGTLGGPTFTHPQDVQLNQTYVFGRLVAVRLVDRRDGKTYAVFASGQAYPGQ